MAPRGQIRDDVWDLIEVIQNDGQNFWKKMPDDIELMYVREIKPGKYEMIVVWENNFEMAYIFKSDFGDFERYGFERGDEYFHLNVREIR